MSKTIKLSGRGHVATAHVESAKEAVALCKELESMWRCSVDYEEIDDGEVSDPLDPKVFGGGATFASSLSALDRDLFESSDMLVEFAIGSDGVRKVSRIVRRRDPEYVAGFDREGAEVEPEMDVDEDDAMNFVTDSYNENGVYDDEDEIEDDSVPCPSDKWDLVFWVETDEFGRKMEMDPGCTTKALPVMLPRTYHKPLKGEAVGILAAINKGNITHGRQLWLACQRVQKHEASRLWDAFKVVSFLRNKK